MNNSLQRIFAIARKEWSLNTRFLTEYIAANTISPLKSAILMSVVYAGFLKGGEQSLGVVNQGNYQVYVFIGTTCHSVLMASVYIFKAKMTMEKWWQTITATLVAPATIMEVIVGYILGSGAINVVLGICMFALITYLFPVAMSAFLISILVLFLLALFGFGMGLIGATISLCWEGKSFIFDYGMQALIFLSCFYYPIDTMPNFIHSFIQALPTYHAAQLIHELYLYGSSTITTFTLLYLGTTSLVALVLPAIFFEYSVKRFGIVGY